MGAGCPRDATANSGKGLEMNLKNLVVGFAGFVASTHVMAVEPWAPTDSEFASLPPFCKVRMKSGSSSPDYKMWESTLGKDFVHTHHYCAGLNFINRYYRARTKNDKNFNLQNAEDNLKYMIAHAEPTYSLMPDVYLNLGKVYALSGQPAQAIIYLNKAIELNPRQPAAYSALADYYTKSKQTAKALEIVTDGLRYNPDTNSLQHRYKELGGKLPYPAPVEPAQIEHPVAQPAVEAVAPVPPRTTPAAPDVESPATSTQEPSRPGIGSPANPYCRFCPN
jgi:hypothetical protein